MYRPNEIGKHAYTKVHMNLMERLFRPSRQSARIIWNQHRLLP